jgi:outer membrane receptor protein involved in Fe transport
MPAPVWAAVLAALVAHQEPASSEDEVAGEIIVTGERVKRSLRDTSSSVAVIGQAEIEAAGANRLDQILSLIPNVQLSDGTSGPIIRGQDTTGALYALPAFLGGNRPRATTVVDGRPVTYNEFIFGTAPVWDVNHIEVFRSPQTTTQGQNSIAGAIFVNSNDPTFDPEYRARAIIGDYGVRQVSALASGPVAGDDLAFRVAGDFRYSRTTSKIFDWVEDADPNHDVYGLVRAKLLYKPTEATRATLTYTHTQSKAPQIVGLTAPFSERQDEFGGYGVFKVNVDALTAAVEHEAGKDISVHLLVTGADRAIRRFAPSGLGQTTNNGGDWTAEAVLNWAPDGPLRLVGGASHTHVYLKQFIDLSLLSNTLGRFRDWQDGTGIFGEAELTVAPGTTLSAGLRYQRDRQKRQGVLGNGGFSVPADFIGKFDALLPKVSLSHDFSQAFRAGVLVQKAYNPGGTTIRFDTGLPDNFDAETLWDYEVFTRTELDGGRFVASTNLFYYDMRNAQRSESIGILTPNGIPVGFANLFNVPKAHSYGFEADAVYRFSDELTVRAAIGLLRSRVTETNAESEKLKGEEFDRSPHFSGSAAFDWKPAKEVQISAQVRHHGSYGSDPGNSKLNTVPPATIVDARFEYALGRITLFGQVRNLFDSLGLLLLSDDGLSASAEDPIQVNVGLEARF